MCCLNLMYVFIVLVMFGLYWEIAAHSAYDMFSRYNLVFPTSVFGVGISF